MKKNYLLFILLLGLITIRCTDPRPKTIEKPTHGLQNTKTVEINKIVLTDSATILYMDAYFYPGNWIQIDSATYIQADGKKYTITGSDSIELNKKHWMPDSGEDHFTLYFPPLPKGTKIIDFIESDCDNCFKIWDIDLTGKNKTYKPQLPDNINTKIDKEYKLPEPVFKAASSKITFHLTGLKEGYAIGEPELNINNLFTKDMDEYAGKKESDGTYTFEVDLYSTSTGFITFSNNYLNVVLNPGENLDIYYDLTAFSKNTSRYHPQPDLPFCTFNGSFDELNTQILQYRDTLQSYSNTLNVFAGRADSTILEMNNTQYVDYVFKDYDKKMAKLEKADLPQAIKQVIKNNLKDDVIYNIGFMNRIYEANYRVKNNLDWDKPLGIQFPKATEKDLISLKKLDLNDPMLLYSKDFKYSFSNISGPIPPSINIETITGSKTGLLRDLREVFPVIFKASEPAELSSKDESILSGTGNPYYKEVYDLIFKKTKQLQKEVLSKGGFKIESTPDVEKDKVLETIVSKYKGKVVFIDIWATWCGPCIGAMKTIKTIKPTMIEKGIVSLYVSGETSPKNKWMSMLPEIGGIHYYLKDEQWNALYEKYKFNGIPTYMIFDKKGKMAFKATGYPGNNKILEELEKVL